MFLGWISISSEIASLTILKNSDSDRVIVLSKRPAKIKSVYEINLTNKSTPINNRKAKEFGYYYDLLWKDLDKNV